MNFIFSLPILMAIINLAVLTESNAFNIVVQINDYEETKDLWVLFHAATIYYFFYVATHEFIYYIFNVQLLGFSDKKGESNFFLFQILFFCFRER